MRWLLVALTISGCGFSIDADPASGGDDDPGPVPGVDADMAIPRMCSTADDTLRLCIDFDDTVDMASDGSISGLAVEAVGLRPEMRATENAALVDGNSHISIDETPKLDISEDLTVSMWIRADFGSITQISNRWLFDNNTQYFASLLPDGAIRCGMGTRTTDSPIVILDGGWHHVACTYQDDEMRVYVDGVAKRCQTFATDRDIPIGGDDGFAIGANLSVVGGVRRYAEQFIGGIDNVQVFSRIVSPAELCTAATNGAACDASCP